MISIDSHDNRDQCLSMLSETQECTTKRSYFGLKEVNLLVLGRSLREVRISIQYDDLISNTGLITKLLFVSHLFKHNRYIHKECELFYLRLWFHLQGWSYRHVKNKNVSLFVSFFTTIIYLINASGKYSFRCLSITLPYQSQISLIVSSCSCLRPVAVMQYLIVQNLFSKEISMFTRGLSRSIDDDNEVGNIYSSKTTGASCLLTIIHSQNHFNKWVNVLRCTFISLTLNLHSVLSNLFRFFSLRTGNSAFIIP